MPGGARPGAGRKLGVPNKKTQQAVAAAQAHGLLPHEFLLAVAQGRADVLDGEVPSLDQRIDAAKAAAPFYAPKLASVEHKNGEDGPFKIIMHSGDADL